MFSHVFAFGISRTGTTLLTTVLDSHPDVSMGYELLPTGIDDAAAASQLILSTDVDDAHRETAGARLRQLRVQRDDLAACYDRLLDEIAAGTGRFKFYRQFKMYNDPTLNPALVAERAARPRG